MSLREPHKIDVCVNAFTQRSKVWDIRGFMLESDLTNVVNVIGSSLGVSAFGVTTEFMQERNCTNILNMEILLRNHILRIHSGFHSEENSYKRNE